MSGFDLAVQNLTSPVVLAFALGVVAALARSDLKLPPAVSSLLSTYLLLAIGLKGGYQLTNTAVSDLAWPLVATIALGLVTPVVAYIVLRRVGRFATGDSAGIAAHYGSVSVVTFTAAVGFTQAAGLAPEGFLPTLVAVLEVPGIVVALAIAQLARGGGGLREAVHEVVTGKSIVLLLGGLAMGAVGGERGMEQVAPLFVAPFKGMLVLFLLDLGVVAGQRLADVRKAGTFLVGFALATPVVFGTAGVLAGTAAGLGVGGAAVLGAMAASASYIAAPAAVQVALPDANPGYSLTAALAITFPFNLTVGIPLYAQLAGAVG